MVRPIAHEETNQDVITAGPSRMADTESGAAKPGAQVSTAETRPTAGAMFAFCFAGWLFFLMFCNPHITYALGLVEMYMIFRYPESYENDCILHDTGDTP